MRLQKNSDNEYISDLSMLPKNLKSARRAAGKSQLQVAQAAGIGRSAISHYERGERIPELDTLQKIAAALHTTIGHLMGEDEGDLPPITVSEFKMENRIVNMNRDDDDAAWLKEVLQDMKQMSPRDKRMFMELCNTYRRQSKVC